MNNLYKRFQKKIRFPAAAKQTSVEIIKTRNRIPSEFPASLIVKQPASLATCEPA